ncbi:MAG: winged helix-turn-helix domain-containing protein [Methanomicrobiales archaeon]|nr:winged helix-turn-helix domain-containing protein [Methanomicrobiales archaeon]MDI6877362.1 winged helix-turn-helix domain-containing protein [Methanomicrobiales archaeon]
MPRRTPYEIYWEILVFCRTPRSFTQIVNRCDLNSRIGQDYLEFLAGKGYLAVVREGEKRVYRSTERAREYVSLFTDLYRTLFDKNPGFRL